MKQRITAFHLLRPLSLAAALGLAGAPASAQQAPAPDTISSSVQAAPANAASPVAPPAGAPAATPEQQAALAGARAAATPAPANALAAQAPSAAGSLLQTIVSLGFVIALLVGLAWLLKRFGPKHMSGGSQVKLVGALSVGARERILVVEVGEQWIVVGASPGRMNALATMPRQPADDADLAAGQAAPGANFAEWFKQTIDKRNGK
ncbi:flagellar protein FliO/FliZ [Duganella sp. CF458]|uniref:flagellar biosynthetic protein FliO n=1 Tax=Duganella sp. CF458 TaxID=1884368 RepID=UPI0008E6C783|nr:flagellar biosynthetic protein FliO [Duganella sp. CF458]SFG57426.1 flagellar protein FliO/FliZ [Duganella sp. CF458]